MPKGHYHRNYHISPTTTYQAHTPASVRNGLQ